MRIRSESMIAVSLSMFLMISASILTLPKAAADDYIDSASVSIPASCSMTGTGLVHSAEVNNGQTVYDIGLTNIKVFCNDRLGFAIYAIGYTDDTYGKTVLSNSALGSSFDIETSATIVDATSSWAMKLAAVSGTYTPIIVGSSADTEQGDPDFSNYAAVPEEYTKVAYFGSTTDSGASATGSNLTVTYMAHVSRFQPAGTYVGQVKYTIVHPKMAAAPSLYCNPDGTTITTIGCMQDLNANNKASVLASMTEDQQYTLRDSRDDKVYYVSKLRDGNIWMTQNLDFDIDSSKTYTSGDTDLPNGVTWTPDRSTYQEDELDSWSVDDEDNYILQSYDVGDLYSDPSLYIAQSYAMSCLNGQCDESVYDQLSSEWRDYIDTCDVSFSNCDDSLIPEINSTSDTGDKHYHVGNYYSFAAAVAKNDITLDIDNMDSINDSVKYYDFEQSICPAGWTLANREHSSSSEISESSDEFIHLLTFYGYGEQKSGGDSGSEMLIENGFLAPLYISNTGTITKDNNIPTLTYDNGALWSSTATSQCIGGYSRCVNPFIITAGDNGAVGTFVIPWFATFNSGLSVRCVAR